MEILGEMNRLLVKLPKAASRAFYPEHLITLANVNHQLILHEIGTKGNLRSVKAMSEEVILQQAGIKHDVPMVGHIKVRSQRGESGKPATRELIYRLFNNLFVDTQHGICLEVMNGLKRQQRDSRTSDSERSG